MAKGGSVGVAALLLLLHACDGADVPGAPPLTSGPASNTLYTPGEGGSDMTADQVAQAVCSKLLSCQLIPPKYAQDCRSETLKSTAFLLDSASFVACFEALSCSALSDLDALSQVIMTCVDIDLSSLGCVGNSLHYCNTQAVCKDLPCSTYCDAMGYSGDRCIEVGSAAGCSCGYLGD